MKRRAFMGSLGAGLVSGLAPRILRRGLAKASPTNAETPSPSAFPKIVHHGMVLGGLPNHPTARRTSFHTSSVLSCNWTASHCLLLASMDEQGGPDLCVGNDAFVFEKLSDIKAENAIPINRVETHYKFKTAEGYGFRRNIHSRARSFPWERGWRMAGPIPAAGDGDTPIRLRGV